MRVDYGEINRAVLDGRDVDLSRVEKTAEFYDYLLNNRIAGFYVSQLSTDDGNATESDLREKARAFRERYVATLECIDEICRSNGIDYLLYKSHFYVPQMADGDVDLIIRPDQFDLFMKAFESNGFDCVADEPSKGKCTKAGLSIVEPHANISWNGSSHASQQFLWESPLTVEIEGARYATVSLEVELLALMAKVVFGPEYLDLHGLKTLRYLIENGVDTRKALAGAKSPGPIERVLDFAGEEASDQKFPRFLGTLEYLKVWTVECIKNRTVTTYGRHVVYFFYWKYRYMAGGRLPFTHHHEW